nr:SufE family protein [uncultured Capnocytophaga sp.]
MTITQIQENLIADFTLLENWEDRYEYMISLGKQLPMIDSQYKTENYLIKGCQSQVWLHADCQCDTIYFTADSDAIITKGIIAILIQVLSGQKATDILHADMSFIDKIGLKEHLSPTRANGLVSMIEQMKLYAQATLLNTK